MDKEQKQVRVSLKIAGRVQGVYFRASTVSAAQELGLTGWVSNCTDGSVEALAEGAEDKIEEFIAWCRHGPSGARVEKIYVERQAAKQEFQSFRIRR